MGDKQTQKAGDNVVQMQIAEAHVTVDFSESRVREICTEVAKKVIADNSYEANELALKRIDRFTDLVLPRIQRLEKDFSSFADPAFQVLLRNAQKTAACTDSDADYELLSELLVRRIEKKDERKVKASIAKAVEIVDQIDGDALCALTVYYIINSLIVVFDSIDEGIKKLDELFSSVLYIDLPTGTNWIEHLDVLNTIRIGRFSSFKKLEDYYFEVLNGYSCVGIKYGSDEYQKALELLQKVHLPVAILKEHELLDGYVRLPVSLKERIKYIACIIPVANSPSNLKITLTQKLTQEQIEILGQIWDLYSTDATQTEIVKKAFIKKLSSFQSIEKVCLWWNNLKTYFDITSVGKVLAHANAQRCHKDVPSFDEEDK